MSLVFRTYEGREICDTGGVMAEVGKPKVLRLELMEEQIRAFRTIQKTLGHDEPEQTFEKMMSLICSAVSLTSREQSKVRLYTRNTPVESHQTFTCPHCAKTVSPPARTEDDGFREVVVDLL
jgi:hypothetical protein